MNSSREDYLQAIYRLSKETGYTSNKSIASFLCVSKPSVTEMVRKLTKAGLVTQSHTKILLTDEGKSRAQALLSDHRLWEYFLSHILGINSENVHEQADLLEHVTGDELREALNRFLDYPTESPTGKTIYKNQNK